MNISTIEIKKLAASEGMVLTNGEAYSSVGGYVYLPKDTDISGWFEITQEQYEFITASGQNNDPIEIA